MLDPNLPTLQPISTPALLLDAGALARNIEAMAAFARAKGVGLRPHGKSHKSSHIARLQLEAGAVGISCATVAEIDAFDQAGITGLLLTSPVMDRPKLERLATIAGRSAISIAIDHPAQIEVLSEMLGEGPELDVLIDVDVGQRRTGVCDVASTVGLAQLIAGQCRMRFGGLQGFAGQIQHIVDARERKEQAKVVSAVLSDHLGALREAGFAAPVVTGSGTGACAFDAHGPYTELQVGSYLFMDAEYARLLVEGGGPLPYEPSLFVLGTVTSVNRAGAFTVDAGVKAMAFNGPLPELLIGAPPGSHYRFGGDEHGIVTLPPGRAAPKLGSRILLLTPHCDPTVNLHASYQVVGHNNGVDSWPVLARYGA